MGINKYCNFCCKWLTFDNHHQWMAHRSNCIKNPNRNKKIEKIKIAIEKRHKIKIYTFFCSKCGKKYNLKLSEQAYAKGKYRKHCSRSCANSRIVTLEQRKKVSDKLKGRMIGANKNKKEKQIIKKKCKLCEKYFFTKQKKQNYCSRLCSSRFNIKIAHNMNRNGINEKAYKNGKKVYGGRTIWYNYENIKVQGTYELLTCYILDIWKEIERIKYWKYVNDTNDRFLYIGLDGKEHTYITDFKVYLHDNSFYYIEVKKSTRKNDNIKWQAVKNKGYHIEVWNLNKIKKNSMNMVIIV